MIYATPRGVGVKALGYNAAQDKGRRQAPRSRYRSEDIVLAPKVRKRLDETALDQFRNFSLVAWMVRAHLDSVAGFRHHVRTGNRDLDKYLYDKVTIAGRRANFDVSGRFSRSQAMRMFEASKMLYGDGAFYEAGGGLRQIIEGRMIGCPDNFKGAGLSPAQRLAINEHGLDLDPLTRRLRNACILKPSKDGRTKEFAALVSSEDLIFDGYWNTVNSSRGVSPLSTALNMVADLYEGIEYTQLKIKLHALFGIVIKQKIGDEDGFPTETESDTDYGPNAADEDRPRAEVRVGNGIMNLNLAPGEDASTIESQTPNSQFMDFSGMAMRIILRSADMPFTMFDSMKSTFSARIADVNQYEHACRWKREKNQDVLNELTSRDVDLWMETDATLRQLAAAAGLAGEQLKTAIHWKPLGSPWIDKVAEVEGDSKAIALGLDSSIKAATRRGEDFFENIDEQAEAQAYADSKGVVIMIGDPGQSSVKEKRAAEDKKEADASGQGDQ